MDPRPAGRPVSRFGSGPTERGFVTIEFIAAVALSLLVLVVAANFVVSEYGRGVVRSAVDQGARDGARTATPEATCEASARQAISDLLGSGKGSMGAAVTVSCTATGDRVEATASGSFPGWLPAVPAWGFTSRASAVREQVP